MKKLWIAVFFLLILTQCHRQEPLYQAEPFYVFGTLVGISIWGSSPQQAQDAVKVIAEEFQILHRRWHAWNPSPVTELNQALATGQSYTVTEPSLLTLLNLSKEWSHRSQGMFNPALGKLVALWGFHQDELPQGPPPSAEAIKALVQLAPKMEDLYIQDHQVSSRNPAVQLDFGAIAKGYAVDLAVEKLKTLGIKNAIVNAGGNLKAFGKKGEHPWWIGIRHPNGEGVLAALAIEKEESVMTSGNYERYREYAGKRYSHLIDPRTGMPAQGLTSVTVVHDNGAVADVASTALTIAGLSGWWSIAQQMGLKYVMLVDEQGTVTMSPAMAQRVQFQTGKEPKIIISPPLEMK